MHFGMISSCVSSVVVFICSYHVKMFCNVRFLLPFGIIKDDDDNVDKCHNN